MPLVQTPAVQPALTTVERQVRARDAIKQRSTQAFQMLKGTAMSLAQIVWANPEGLTPQEVLDAVGHDAAALFQVSSLVSQILAIATGEAPAAVMPPGWTYTINPDGTVAVTKPEE